ncbi:MAG: pseudouridine synthase, partial [Bernardetiaceae bacterium]|nr:pseudouridine synthase [Bernardetiaceae bacterium]
REGGFNRKPRFGDDNDGGKPFNREGGFNRKPRFGEEGGEGKPFNREGGFNRKPRFGDDNDGGKPFNREGGFNRKPRFGDDNDGGKPFNREGGFNRKPRFGDDNDGGKSFNREGGFNRKPRFGDGEGKPFNREGGFNRKPRFGDDNDGGKPFNREGGFNRKPRFGDDNDGGKSFNREGGFNRKPRFGDDNDGGKPFNREGGFNRKPRFGDDKPFGRKSEPRNPFTKRSKRFEREDGSLNFRRKGNKSEAPAPQPENENGEIRLNRFIANAGVCSRREADELITKGRIMVNGQVVTTLGSKVKPGDEVVCDGERLTRERKVYLLLNKPKDYITTTDDPEERKTVMELIKDAGTERVYPVGRLDRNTTGVLLFTNDGELAKKLAHPSHHIKKNYQLELTQPLTEAHFDQIKQQGVTLDDGEIKPDDLFYLTDDRKVLSIDLHSGRNRIVRRIFEHLGYEILKLDRASFAGITKKNLPRGQWRHLTPQEVIRLKHFVH